LRLFTPALCLFAPALRRALRLFAPKASAPAPEAAFVLPEPAPMTLLPTAYADGFTGARLGAGFPVHNFPPVTRICSFTQQQVLWKSWKRRKICANQSALYI
jgi:hypothetical protein